MKPTFDNEIHLSTKRFSISILLCLFIAACSNPEKEKLEHIAKGQAYLNGKRYAEARIEFRSALQIDKRLAAAQFGLGEAALSLGYVQEAAEAYYETMRLDASNLDARIRVGSLLAEYDNEESLKEAERLAGEVLQRKPDSAEGRVLLASVHISRKKWDDAKAELDRAISLDPDRIETRINLARYYDRRAKADPAEAAGFRSQAEAVFKQLVEKNPGATNVRISFADFLFTDKRNSEAERQLLAAHRSDPQDKLTLVALRRYYESQQRYDEAENYTRKLAELDPDKTAGRAQIIDLHARTGRIYQAVSEYQQLLKDDPKYLRAYSRLAELLLELGDMTGATKNVDAALKQNAQDTDALLMRGRLNTLNGRYREAVNDLDQVLRMEPTMPSALYYASDAHLANNDATQARLYVNRLLNFYPRNPMGLLMQVRVHLHEGKAADAERTATEIIENVAQLRSNPTALEAARIPQDTLPEWESKAFVSRAVSRIQLRNFDGAKSDLERAVEIDKRGAEPHINLAAIHLLLGDLPKAQSEAERAVDLAPSNISAATTLTNVYLRRKNYHAAQLKLDQLLAAQPNRLQLLELKSRVHIAEGDAGSAEKLLQQIIETDPNYLNAYFVLSDFYQSSQQKSDRAINQLRDVIRLRPNNIQQVAQAHLLVGLLEEGRGNFDEAARNYEQMLSYDKRSVGAAIAMNNLAWIYADKGSGNLDKATDHARNAINITPEASFYDTLGYAYYKKRQYEIAAEQFTKAIGRNPAKANYHLHLARALRDNGETQKARQAYERALQVGGTEFSEANQARQELAALRKS
jgi:tetratricopeptide (TPR) repeat protein